MMASGRLCRQTPVPVKLNAPVDEGKTKVQVIFPSDGQYIAFLDFVPRGGKKISLAVPIKVGAGGSRPLN